MNHWVAAFVGDGARENFEAVRRTNTFHVSSNKTPIRRARPGDRLLFYMAGEGFVAEGKVFASAEPPGAEPQWSSKEPPTLALPVTDLRPFERPILYRFRGDGNHPVLGFHRYALTGGFLALPETGFEDVLGWAGPPAPPRADKVPETTTPAEPPAREAKPLRPAPVAPQPHARAATPPELAQSEREKRAAGQHALSEGRKRVALWTVAEMGAGLFGLRGARRFAGDKARAAENTWLAGGRAEEKVGRELEALRAQGFYLFHDVPLPGVGNVDHVVLGGRGFFSIETKSHKGRVTTRAGKLLRDERPFEGDFVKQAWRGCYRLREILGTDDVAPLLLFTNAFVEGRITARGVRVLPLRWCVGEILKSAKRHDSEAVKLAVARLSKAAGCHPSSAPRPA